MKFILLFFIVFNFIQLGFSQSYINGPANIRNKPKGEIMLQLEDAVQVFVIEKAEDWYKIEINCLVKDLNFDDQVIPKNTVLYNNQLYKIGTVLTEMELDQYIEPTENNRYARVSFQLYTYKNNLKQLSFDEIQSTKDLIISDSDQANIAIFRENGMEFLQKTDISYEYKYFFDGDDIVRYLIRKKETTKNVLDAEGVSTDITLLFYPNLSEKDTFSYTKHANRFDLQDNMLISTLYGCCGAEDYFEISTFLDNQTFLEFNSRYFVIRVPNTQNTLMFGFNVEPRYENQDKLLIGELNYSFNYKKSGKVQFFAASKEQLDNIVPYTPEIKFISITEKDNTDNYEEYSELSLWSIDQETELSKITNTGIKITFTDEQSGQKKEFRIIADNGRINDKNITVDFSK